MSKKTFNVNNTLYPDSFIQEGIAEFQGYQITYFQGTITIDDEDPTYVFDELMNYILSLTLEHSLGA